MHIGMYYSLNLHLELADRARDADPASYSQRPLDAMLSRVYGLWTIGEQWELWMMCHNESDPNYVRCVFMFIGRTVKVKD